MALPKLLNGAKVATTTTGTGTVTLGTVVSGGLTWANAGAVNGQVYCYAIKDGADLEIGWGTYTSSGTTLSRDTVLRSTNAGAKINLTGNAIVYSTITAEDMLYAGSNLMPANIGMTASASANALTLALKGLDGNDPSATNPVVVPFRNVTAATGTPDFLVITSALSLTITSGATLGAANNTGFRGWIVIFNDGGTPRLGVININATTDLSERNPIASSTAMSASADNAGTYYTDSAVTSKAFTVIGYFDYTSGLSTAGTWASGPTNLTLFAHGLSPPSKLQTRQIFTSSGTWTKPFLCRLAKFTAVGAGAAGGPAIATGASQSTSGGGGGAGGLAIAWTDVTSIASRTITIGAGGTGSTSGVGQSGGSTSVGSDAVAGGGTGGSPNGAAGSNFSLSPGGAGGTASAGTIQASGSPGSTGIRTDASAVSGVGGSSIYGAGGNGVGAVTGGAAGNNASGYGGGGSGAANSASQSARAGGNGTDGLVIVEEYY